MSKNVIAILYVALMTASIVSVDFLFLRHRLRERLVINIAIILVFAAVYLLFLKNR